MIFLIPPQVMLWVCRSTSLILICVTYEQQQRLDLHEFKIINILSLSPRNDFFKPISWGVDFGFQQQWLKGKTIHPLQVTAQAGVDYLFAEHWQANMMLQTQLAAHRHFAQQVNMGVGSSLGLLYTSTQLHSLFEIKALEFSRGDKYQTWQLNWQLNLPIQDQQGIRISAQRQMQDNIYLRNVHEITDAATTCLFAPAQKISIVAYASYAPLEII